MTAVYQDMKICHAKDGLVLVCFCSRGQDHNHSVESLGLRLEEIPGVGSCSKVAPGSDDLAFSLLDQRKMES